MINTDKISVIVPAYNVENYIRNTVHSICNQTYQNIEIILVNDGSIDGTAQILDKLSTQDKRIKVVHKENGGVTSARLYGVEQATGEWIGFVDGDDYIEPQMYEVLLGNAIKYGVQISHCGYQMVFPNRVDLYYGTDQLVEQDKQTGVKDLLEGSFVEPGLWNKLFHKNLIYSLLNEKKMDLSIKNNEDLLMNYFLFCNAEKSVFTDQCYYHYMVRKGSAATASLNEHKLRDPLRVLRILEEETEQEAELQLIVRKRIIGQLVNLSTLPLGEQAELIRPYRLSARNELHQILPEILKNHYSYKQKLAALWVCIWPASYGWIHRVYTKITGLDKKYEVN